MANIDRAQVAVTTEGIEDIATMVAEGTTFLIGYFRLTDLADVELFEAKKQWRSISEDAFYLDYSADDFDAARGEDIIGHAPSSDPSPVANGYSDFEGYITVNSIELADHITVEINCYIAPGVLLATPVNEIMIYTGNSTDGYRSFMWGIFPEITKLQQYGLNFRVFLQF